MKKHLFLTGPSGIGKTTLLREELGWMLQTAGGLATVRECDSSGRVLGYDLLPAAALGGVEGYTPLRFLDYSVDPPVRDNEVYRSEGVRLLNEAPYYSFALLDEIGGYELLIPEFRHALEELLNSETPIIGVLKGRENAADATECGGNAARGFATLGFPLRCVRRGFRFLICYPQVGQ